MANNNNDMLIAVSRGKVPLENVYLINNLLKVRMLGVFHPQQADKIQELDDTIKKDILSVGHMYLEIIASYNDKEQELFWVDKVSFPETKEEMKTYLETIAGPDVIKCSTCYYGWGDDTLTEEKTKVLPQYMTDCRGKFWWDVAECRSCEGKWCGARGRTLCGACR